MSIPNNHQFSFSYNDDKRQQDNSGSHTQDQARKEKASERVRREYIKRMNEMFGDPLIFQS